MKRPILILCALALLMVGCRTAKVTETIVVTTTDSIRTEYIETIKIDTITVEVRVPSEVMEHAVKDSASHVETTLAESDAWLNSDGTLGHSIRNKDVPIRQQVTVPIKDIHSSTEHARQVPVPYPEKVLVERAFTDWEKFKLNYFWYFIAITAASLAWSLRGPAKKAIRYLFVLFRKL